MLEVSSFAELGNEIAMVVSELYVYKLKNIGMVELLDDIELVVQELEVSRAH